MRIENYPLQKEFGSYLQSLRERTGLSQRAIGDKVGVTGSYIALLEKGLRNFPSKQVLRRLAEVYGLTEEKVQELIWRYSDEVVIEWPETLLHTGKKGNWESDRIDSDRLSWAYQCVRSDPSVTLKSEIGKSDLVFANMAYVVFEYQRKTRRKLLRSIEQQGLIEWLERGGYVMKSEVLPDQKSNSNLEPGGEEN